MSRSVHGLAALALGGALVLTGCNSYSCKNDECHVTVSGADQILEVNGLDVRVIDIGDAGVTLSVQGSRPAKIPVGETAQVGPVQIRVTSVEGNKAKFDMR